MTITEKVAYLKGLADGMNLKESDETKLFKKTIEILEDIADSIECLEDDLSEVCEQVDAIDEDLDELECDFYDLDDEELDDDDEYYEVTCPTCGDTIYLDEDLLLEGGIKCPNCNEELEFDIPCGCGCEDDDCDVEN